MVGKGKADAGSGVVRTFASKRWVGTEVGEGVRMSIDRCFGKANWGNKVLGNL